MEYKFSTLYPHEAREKLSAAHKLYGDCELRAMWPVGEGKGGIAYAEFIVDTIWPSGKFLLKSVEDPSEEVSLSIKDRPIDFTIRKVSSMSERTIEELEAAFALHGSSGLTGDEADRLLRHLVNVASVAPQPVVSMSHGKLYGLFRQYMANELGIGKPQIMEWVVAAIDRIVERMLGQINIQGKVEDRVKRVVDAQIREAIASGVDRRLRSMHIDIKVQDKVGS